MLRPGARTHAECREPEPRTNPGVPAVEPEDRVCGVPKGGGLQLGRTHVGGARVRKFGQDGARADPCLRGEGNGVERLADDPADPGVPGYGEGVGKALPAPPICQPVHGFGHRPVGGSGPCPRALERAGDTVHSATRVRTVRPNGICPAGADLSGAPVHPAPQCAVPQSGCSSTYRASRPPPLDRAAGAVGAGEASRDLEPMSRLAGLEDLAPSEILGPELPDPPPPPPAS